MNNKTAKIAYWIVTVIMCALFAFSASLYFRNTEGIQGYFVNHGYPAHIVIPLAIAKVLGIVAVISNRSKMLTEWAYAGFFFDVILATAAHHHAGDGIIGLSFWGIFLVLASRLLWKYRTAS